jgi:alpha-1,3-rhamnosyl/mannosyltransferase
MTQAGRDLVKVVIDLSALRTLPLTGVGHYVLHLWNNLKRLERPYELGGYPAAHLASARRGGAARAWAGSLRQIARRLPLVPRLYYGYRAWNARRYDLRGCLFHEPNYILPRFDVPSIVSVHDLSALRFPEWHPGDRSAVHERALLRSIAHASHVLTGSQCIRRELIETYGVQPDKVTAIPYGVDESYRPRSVEECAAALKTYGLVHKRYILMVGTLEPRKNLERVLDAYRRLPRREQAALPLVLAGDAGWRSGAILEAMKRLEGRVKHVGYVPAARLPYLYAGARATLYPSLYEGFGLPALESIAAGTPVLTSLGTAMEEFAGDAAVWVDPRNVDSVFHGLRELIETASLNERVRRRAPEIRNAFSWRRCAEATSRLYSRVISNHAASAPHYHAESAV